MNEKGFLKIKVNEHERTMHYIIDEGKIKTISTKDSGLIKDAELGQIYVNPSLKGGTYVQAKLNVIYDLAQVKTLFDRMLVLKHTWFKEFSDQLVIIEVIL